MLSSLWENSNPFVGLELAMTLMGEYDFIAQFAALICAVLVLSIYHSQFGIKAPLSGKEALNRKSRAKVNFPPSARRQQHEESKEIKLTSSATHSRARARTAKLSMPPGSKTPPLPVCATSAMQPQPWSKKEWPSGLQLDFVADQLKPSTLQKPPLTTPKSSAHPWCQRADMPEVANMGPLPCSTRSWGDSAHPKGTNKQKFFSNPGQTPIDEETSQALKTLHDAMQAEDWELALKCLIIATTGGIRIIDRTWCNVLAGCVSNGIAEVAEQALEPVQSLLPVVGYNILMKAYVKKSATEKCFELHNKMLNAGASPSAFTCGILLDAHIANHDMDKAMALFRDMEHSKHVAGKPNSVHYTTLLKGLIQSQRIQDAVTFFKEIPKPDVVAFSTLIKAHCDAGMVNEAVELLNNMGNAGVKPDDIVFNTLLSNCSRTKNLALGRKLFSQMMKLSIVPSTTTLEHLVRLYYRTSRPDLAAELLEQVAKLKGSDVLVGTPKAYLDLLQNCIQQGHSDQAWRMYKAMALQTSMKDPQYVLKLFQEGGNSELTKRVLTHLRMVVAPEACLKEDCSSQGRGRSARSRPSRSRGGGH